MSDGWVKIHRKMTDSDLWKAEPFSRGQAWVDMILLANHRPGYIRTNGMRVDLDRGQLGWSEAELGKRWKWSRGKVRRFLSELRNDENTVHHTVHGKSIITICNYNEYQGDGTGDGTAYGTGDGTGGGTGDGTLTRRTKKNKEKKEDISAKPKLINLPPDWQPTLADRDYAKSQGHADQSIDDMVMGFVLHFTEGNGRNKKRPGWSKTWMNWVRNDKKFYGVPKDAPKRFDDGNIERGILAGLGDELAAWRSSPEDGGQGPHDSHETGGGGDTGPDQPGSVRSDISAPIPILSGVRNKA